MSKPKPSGKLTIVGWVVSVLLLVALPLLGLVATGHDPVPYLDMPPTTQHVQHAGFSWGWFVFFAIVDVLMLGGLLLAIRSGDARKPHPSRPIHQIRWRFPWWGWAGLLLCLLSWLMAWQRFTWFWLFQPHTFLPIWSGFILVVNGLSVKRSGSCLMVRRPIGFALLFPVSAMFWWMFEWFNRFVQNWYYTGIEGMGPGEYSYYSSLAFSTVLPGVLSMVDLMLTIPRIGHGLAHCKPISLPASRWIPLTALVVFSIGLTLIGIFPDQLFALLWVSPLLIILSLQRLAGQPTILRSLTWGDWRPVVTPALAALVCGFFWEMWNYFSLARWTYTIPFVQRFQLFEMPILGYGGYLPFGLECLLAGSLVIGDPFASSGLN